ncbi:MAG TPA: serine/threonine-protein kinase, partial [Gammaproteobacteria bacterium]|nr:serine/threonine-protein kinase [Gammaproteobacteria bacterium]
NATCQILRIEHLPTQNPEEVYQELTELPFPPPLLPGVMLDGYRIVREIHASNRTQIYLAIDTESGQKVALKTPSVNYEDDPAYIERFILEEWVGRRIDNPHVVKVFPPTWRRRFLYHLTEYLEGVTLRQWLRDHPKRELEEMRRIVEQIARGLRAFHRLEMLHQDLKPENIMVDFSGHVKLVDFGSTRVGGIAEIATPIERVNLLGTRNYCAPEYFRNQPGTTASDIYSLGVIAYELLTDRLPYGEMPRDAANPKFLQRLHYTPAVDRDPAIPEWVDGALRKAVHLDPKRRYSELSEFIHDLRHPNPAFANSAPRPLLERNPVAFWRGLAITLMLLHVVWLYLLTR